MKYLICFFLTAPLFAQTLVLESGSGTYQVKHLIKKVQGESKELKGKMSCAEKECEFLVAAPTRSFVSSDSNRDSNMQMTVEAAKYPLVTARGKFPKEDLARNKFDLPLEVEFHGVKKLYQAQVEQVKANQYRVQFTLGLTAHQIERPSLFGVSIDDEVPMLFETSWGVD